MQPLHYYHYHYTTSIDSAPFDRFFPSCEGACSPRLAVLHERTLQRAAPCCIQPMALPPAFPRSAPILHLIGRPEGAFDASSDLRRWSLCKKIVGRGWFLHAARTHSRWTHRTDPVDDPSLPRLARLALGLRWVTRPTSHPIVLLVANPSCLSTNALEDAIAECVLGVPTSLHRQCRAGTGSILNLIRSHAMWQHMA